MRKYCIFDECRRKAYPRQLFTLQNFLKSMKISDSSLDHSTNDRSVKQSEPSFTDQLHPPPLSESPYSENIRDYSETSKRAKPYHPSDLRYPTILKRKDLSWSILNNLLDL